MIGWHSMPQGMSLRRLPASTAGSSTLPPGHQQRTRRRHCAKVVQQAQERNGLHDLALHHPQGLPPQPAPVQPQAQPLEAAGTYAHAQEVRHATSRLQRPGAEQLEQDTHSMHLQAEEAGAASPSTSPADQEAGGQPRQRGQVPPRHGSRGKPFSRSVYRWPRWRDIRDRPHFLEQYPCRDGQVYNVNSFLGKLDPHGGKYYVPPRQYAKFLEEYHQALEDGYLLFLTENYHSQPFRFFMELDFDWEVPDAVVEDVLPEVIDSIVRTAQEFYQVPARPFHVVSMRTIHKVHLNFPEIITTELLAHICRDRVIAACREVIGSRHAGWLDWERVVDFSHGSFRLMGSHKPKHIQRDPPWVYDKAYYKVNFRPKQEGMPAWVPGKIWLQTLMWSSIFPTKSQIRQFEASPAFLDMIYQDLSADQARMEERLRERLLHTQQMMGEWIDGDKQGRDASNRADLHGVASSSSSSTDSLTKSTQDVKLTLKVMPWGEVKAWLRPTRRLESRSKPLLQADKQRRQEALEFARARCTDSRFEELLDVVKSAESLRWQLKGVQQRIAAMSREAKEAEVSQQPSMSSPSQPTPQNLATQHSMHGTDSPPFPSPPPGPGSQDESGSQRRQGSNSQNEQSSRNGRDGKYGQALAQQAGSFTFTDSGGGVQVQGGGMHEGGVHSDSQRRSRHEGSSHSGSQTGSNTGTGYLQEGRAATHAARSESVGGGEVAQHQAPADRTAQVATKSTTLVSTDNAAHVSTGRTAQISTNRAAEGDQGWIGRERGRLEGSGAAELAGSGVTPGLEAQADKATTHQGHESSQTHPQPSLAGQILSQGFALQAPSSGTQESKDSENSGGLLAGGKDLVPWDGYTFPSSAEEKQALLADLKSQEKMLQRRFAQLRLQVNVALDTLSEELRKV